MEPTKALDIYLHGMVLLSQIHLLQGPYPEADGYGEISESWLVPGGEAANAAILLAGFGLKVRLDGPWLGSKTAEALSQGLGRHGVDCSGMVRDPSYPGLEDLVLVGGRTRNVFGRFGGYFSGPEQRWAQPDREALRRAKVVALDPYFGEASLQAAWCCAEDSKPMVSLDCPPDSPLHQAAAFTVVSREYLRRQFPGGDAQALLRRYADATQGCSIFTAGSGEILYARQGQAVRRCRPFVVPVKGTLGAGDAFRAGVVYGLHQGWDDDKTVRFAAATAAMVCTRFPVAADPPSLGDVEGLMGTEDRSVHSEAP